MEGLIHGGAYFWNFTVFNKKSSSTKIPNPHNHLMLFCTWQSDIILHSLTRVNALSEKESIKNFAIQYITLKCIVKRFE